MQEDTRLPRTHGDVPYTLRKRKGQKRMTLSVHGTGKVTLTVPRYVSRAAADAFVREKRSWLLDALARLSPQRRSEKEERVRYEAHKEAARALVMARLKELNAHYEHPYKRVHIRINSSRWGSASRSGTLSFDFRVLFLPPALQDYLLVHELCHLREMNHSPRFWSLVAETVPDYRERRRELRRVER